MAATHVKLFDALFVGLTLCLACNARAQTAGQCSYRNAIEARRETLTRMIGQLPQKNPDEDPSFLDDQGSFILKSIPLAKCEYDAEAMSIVDRVESIVIEGRKKTFSLKYVKDRLAKEVPDMSATDRLGVATAVQTGHADIVLQSLKQAHCQKYLKSIFEVDGATRDGLLKLVAQGLKDELENKKSEYQKEAEKRNQNPENRANCATVRTRPDQFLDCVVSSMRIKADSTKRTKVLVQLFKCGDASNSQKIVSCLLNSFEKVRPLLAYDCGGDENHQPETLQACRIDGCD